jgi:hypothetical protein
MGKVPCYWYLSEATVTPTPRLTLVTMVVATLAYFGLAVLGWGGFAAFFSHPALIALAIALFVLSGLALFSGGNLSSGVREDRGNRWVIAAFALIGLLGAFLPAWTDRKELPLDWRRSLRGRWCAADLAGVCARPSVQRAGRHPARTYPSHKRCLWCHPKPQLSGVAHQFARLGPGFSFGGRRAAHGAHYTAASRAHPCGREAVAHAVRR